MGVEQTDVVIIGGGVAGASLATVLARQGLEVVVLERDEQYRDRNKGELMVPWGWAEVERLGLADALTSGKFSPEWKNTMPDGSSLTIPAGALLPGVPGAYTIGHVASRAGLAEAAVDAGADVRFGATRIDLEHHDTWTVAWDEDGQRHAVRARLVVGADGRGSRTRRRLGKQLNRTKRTHVIASLLVEGTRDLGDQVLVATCDEKLLLAVPLPDDHARLYLVSREERYTGRDDAQRMLQDCALSVIDDPERITDATAVGPCATYGGEDTWVDEPAAGGAVLLGDAAGYNSPIIGQGLSLAMRDVRVISELLLGSDSWDPSTFRPYIEERAERMRRVRFLAQVYALLRLRPDEEVMRSAGNEELQPLLLGAFTGMDGLPGECFTPERRRSLLDLVSAEVSDEEAVPA